MSAVLASLGAAGSPLGRRLIDEDFLDDPYPTYQALREAGPIHWSEEFFGGAWLLTRHDDVEMVLRGARFSAQRTGGWVMGTGDGARAELRGFQRIFARAMLFRDAPDHQRIRLVLNAGFRPAAMQSLVPDIEALVDHLLDGCDAGRGFDFMQHVARPLPARVIAKLMGVENEDDERFLDWSDDLAGFIGAPRPTLDQARRAQASLLAMSSFSLQGWRAAAPAATTWWVAWQWPLPTAASKTVPSCWPSARCCCSPGTKRRATFWAMGCITCCRDRRCGTSCNVSLSGCAVQSASSFASTARCNTREGVRRRTSYCTGSGCGEAILSLG